MPLQSKIDVKVSANLSRQRDQVTTKADLLTQFQRDLDSGTGTGQANICLAKRYTIAAAGTQLIDLGVGAQTDDLGSAIDFTAVKAIMIKAAAANGAAVQLGPNSTEGFADWVNGATAAVRIAAGGMFLLAAPESTGLGVANNSDDKLLLTNLNGSGTATVDVLIIGVGNQT
jgi:hypothetical protein